MSYEFPLVIFTILTQLAVGMAVILCWDMLANKRNNGLNSWFWVAGISAAGLIASLWHLGHPFEAFRALANLGPSSLSWEVLGFACFTILACAVPFGRGWALPICAACVGGLSLFVQGVTYAPPSMPAIANPLPTAIFWLSALALGGSCLTLTRPEEFSPTARLALVALIVGLLAGPSIWLSGSLTMRETGVLWLTSPWFLGGIVLISLALVATWFDAGGKILRFASVVCGIFLTRMAFFADTVHTAANIGRPF